MRLFKSSKRVGVILRYLWVAGGPKIAIYQTKGLVEEKCTGELLILATSPRYKGEYDSLFEGIPHTSVRVPRFVETIELAINRMLFKKWREGERVLPFASLLSSFRRIKNYDVLLCHDPFSGLVGLLGKIFYNKSYVIYLTETPFGNSLFLPIEKLVLKSADAILTISDKIAKDLETLANYKTIPLPPGFPVVQKKRRGNHVLTASRWDPAFGRDSGRRPDWIIKVAKRNPDIKFIVAGYWQSQHLYEDFLKNSSGVRNLVVYSKPVKEDELEELIKSSYAVIRLNINEHGIATIAWEAVHKCVPVIVNSDLGVADYVKAYNAGIVIDRIDTESIEDALKKLGEDYEWYMANCLELSNRYSVRIHVRDLLKIIENL